MKKLFILIPIVFLFACSNQQSPENTTTPLSESILSWEKNGLKLFESKPSPEFGNAELKIMEPQKACYLKNNKVHFKYEVSNYQLGVQTQNTENQHCSNSSQGQHIHLILNNEPYTAHYDKEFDVDLTDGNYIALSFISRSYHESIKTNNAYKLIYFSINKDTTIDTALVSNPLTGEEKLIVGFHISDGKIPFDPKGQHIFYSRPKGEYDIEDCKSLMLDFYLINTTLSENGNKVKATINGTEFILPKWAAYSVEGLGIGEHTFKLELINDKGDEIMGPFNKVERKIIIHGEKS